MKPIAVSSSLMFAFCLALTIPSIGTASDGGTAKRRSAHRSAEKSYLKIWRVTHFGAAVKATPQNDSIARLELVPNGKDQNTSAAALLCDDPTTGYQIPAGASSILVSLSNIENIQSISFLNEGAQGDYTIAMSNADAPDNSPEWQRVVRNTMSSGRCFGKDRLGRSEIRQVEFQYYASRPHRRVWHLCDARALGFYDAATAQSEF